MKRKTPFRKWWDKNRNYPLIPNAYFLDEFARKAFDV